MPLKTVDTSKNVKTGNIAQSYRAGTDNLFGTCPQSCKLCPKANNASQRIDWQYLDVMLNIIPVDGIAFSYSHFDWREWHHAAQGAPCVLNYSADNLGAAVDAMANDVPTVVALPETEVPGKRFSFLGEEFRQCPATYRDDIKCENCGGKKGPMCAWKNRKFAIVFPAHGATKKRVGNEQTGGCYAAGGNTAIHWKATSRNGKTDDASVLREWLESLPRGRIVRHHIAGDIGLSA